MINQYSYIIPAAALPEELSSGSLEHTDFYLHSEVNMHGILAEAPRELVYIIHISVAKLALHVSRILTAINSSRTKDAKRTCDKFESTSGRTYPLTLCNTTTRGTFSSGIRVFLDLPSGVTTPM